MHHPMTRRVALIVILATLMGAGSHPLLAADHDRPPHEGRIADLLHGREERVDVRVYDASKHVHLARQNTTRTKL